MSLMKVNHWEEKETVTHDGKDILRIHLRCPVFEGAREECCKKLNDFYADAAKEFMDFCKKKYAPTLIQKRKHAQGTPYGCGASMNWYLTFENEELLSLITDISVFDGQLRHTRRYAHNWNLAEGVPIPAKVAFSTTSACRNAYVLQICEKIRRGEGGFPYDKQAESAAKRYFSFDQYYLTPRGVAFYYKNGLLFPSDSRYPAFVIPFSQIEGLTLPWGNTKG